MVGDNVMDKIILKAALDFDDREAANKTLKKQYEIKILYRRKRF